MSNIKDTFKQIYYECHGSGPQTYVLLHNAGGDHHFFDPQISFLQNHGRVIAIDLLGHGQSKKPEQAYSLSQHAADINALLSSLNVTNATGIGLNYGANVFIEMGSTQIKRLIMIDPPLFMDDTTRNFVQDHVNDLNNPKNDHYVEDLVSQSFLKGNQTSQDIARNAFQTTPRKILATIYKDLLDWDKNSFSKVQKIDTPSLCIMTDASLCSMAELQACNPKIRLGKVVESLYWATLEVPDQINAMIQRFAAM